jgi:hypothetical protein
VPLENRKLEDADLVHLWSELDSEDAAQADLALWTLTAVPGRSVPFLKDQLSAVPRGPKLAEALDELIANLDSEEFTLRVKASAEVARFGTLAEPALKKALEAKPSLEVRRRIEALLELLNKNRWTGMPLQSWRALAVLERIGTDDARQLLERLAKGDPDARLSQEAVAALERLQRRKAGRGKSQPEE